MGQLHILAFDHEGFPISRDRWRAAMPGKSCTHPRSKLILTSWYPRVIAPDIDPTPRYLVVDRMINSRFKVTLHPHFCFLELLLTNQRAPFWTPRSYGHAANSYTYDIIHGVSRLFSLRMRQIPHLVIYFPFLAFFSFLLFSLKTLYQSGGVFDRCWARLMHIHSLYFTAAAAGYWGGCVYIAV